jgi:hypothetical protein
MTKSPGGTWIGLELNLKLLNRTMKDNHIDINEARPADSRAVEIDRRRRPPIDIQEYKKLQGQSPVPWAVLKFMQWVNCQWATVVCTGSH